MQRVRDLAALHRAHGRRERLGDHLAAEHAPAAAGQARAAVEVDVDLLDAEQAHQPVHQLLRRGRLAGGDVGLGGHAQPFTAPPTAPLSSLSLPPRSAVSTSSGAGVKSAPYSASSLRSCSTTVFSPTVSAQNIGPPR